MAVTKRAVARPLSPHLQIYKPLINMVMSIIHRITGAALYVGSLLLAWWLIAAATGPGYFNFINGLASSIVGKIVLLGYTWALLHHMAGGIRHMIWDTGRGLDLATVDRMSWAGLAASLLGTIAIWGSVMTVRGGF